MHAISLNSLKFNLYLLIFGLIVVLFITNSTTPDRIGPQGITIFFTVLYFIFSLLINITFLLFAKLARSKSYNSISWSPQVAFIYGFIPTTAIALQSLEQLILRDALIFLGLAILGAFYIGRRPKNIK